MICYNNKMWTGLIWPARTIAQRLACQPKSTPQTWIANQLRTSQTQWMKYRRTTYTTSRDQWVRVLRSPHQAFMSPSAPALELLSSLTWWHSFWSRIASSLMASLFQSRWLCMIAVSSSTCTARSQIVIKPLASSSSRHSKRLTWSWDWPTLRRRSVSRRLKGRDYQGGLQITSRIRWRLSQVTSSASGSADHPWSTKSSIKPSKRSKTSYRLPQARLISCEQRRIKKEQ